MASEEEAMAYSRGAVERAMKVREVILRAIDGKLTWVQADDDRGDAARGAPASYHPAPCGRPSPRRHGADSRHVESGAGRRRCGFLGRGNGPRHFLFAYYE